MDELRKYSQGEVLDPADLHPVIRNKEQDTARIAKKLMEIADEVRSNAYSPYSNYKVGAALLCMDGKIYTGVNVETAAFCGVCAERNAVFKAVGEGRRSFAAIAVSGGKKDEKPETCTPCGVCRQVISEFVNPEEFMVIFRNEENEVEARPFEDMLPLAFGPSNLN